MYLVRNYIQITCLEGTVLLKINFQDSVELGMYVILDLIIYSHHCPNKKIFNLKSQISIFIGNKNVFRPF